MCPSNKPLPPKKSPWGTPYLPCNRTAPGPNPGRLSRALLFPGRKAAAPRGGDGEAGGGSGSREAGGTGRRRGQGDGRGRRGSGRGREKGGRRLRDGEEGGEPGGWEVGNEETGFQGDRGERSGDGVLGGWGSSGPAHARLALGGSRGSPRRQESEGRHCLVPAPGPEQPDRTPCPSGRGQHPAGTRPRHHPALTARIRSASSARPRAARPEPEAQGPQVSEGPPVTSPPGRPPRPLQPASREWPEGAPDRSLRPLSAAPAGLRPLGPEPRVRSPAPTQCAGADCGPRP